MSRLSQTFSMEFVNQILNIHIPLYASNDQLVLGYTKLLLGPLKDIVQLNKPVPFEVSFPSF